MKEYSIKFCENCKNAILDEYKSITIYDKNSQYKTYHYRCRPEFDKDTMNSYIQTMDDNENKNSVDTKKHFQEEINWFENILNYICALKSDVSLVPQNDDFLNKMLVFKSSMWIDISSSHMVKVSRVIFKLILEGHYEEASILLRNYMEYLELLFFFRDKPGKIDDWENDKIKMIDIANMISKKVKYSFTPVWSLLSKRVHPTGPSTRNIFTRRSGSWLSFFNFHECENTLLVLLELMSFLLRFLSKYYKKQLENRELSLDIKNVIEQFNQYMNTRESKCKYLEYVHPWCKNTFYISNDYWEEMSNQWSCCEYFCDIDSLKCAYYNEKIEEHE